MNSPAYTYSTEVEGTGGAYVRHVAMCSQHAQVITILRSERDAQRVADAHNRLFHGGTDA